MRQLGLAALGALLLAASAGAGPRADYILHCQGCHGPDGQGAPGAVPAFGGDLVRFSRLPEGRAFLISVPGVSQSSLDDARIARLLNWILAEFGGAALAPDFEPVSGEEVTRQRRPPLVDVAPVRAELLRRIAADGAD